MWVVTSRLEVDETPRARGQEGNETMSVPAESTRPEVVVPGRPAGSHALAWEEQLRDAVLPMPPSYAPNLIAHTPPRAKPTLESAMSYAGILRQASAWARKICTTPVTAGFAWRDG